MAWKYLVILKNTSRLTTISEKYVFHFLCETFCVVTAIIHNIILTI